AGAGARAHGRAPVAAAASADVLGARATGLDRSGARARARARRRATSDHAAPRAGRGAGAAVTVGPRIHDARHRRRDAVDVSAEGGDRPEPVCPGEQGVEARRRTEFDDRGLRVGERRLPFYAGAMHYWRVPPARWDTCLRAIHGLGLTIVETYVP